MAVDQCSDVQLNTKVFFSSFIQASEETMGYFIFSGNVLTFPKFPNFTMLCMIQTFHRRLFPSFPVFFSDVRQGQLCIGLELKQQERGFSEKLAAGSRK